MSIELAIEREHLERLGVDWEKGELGPMPDGNWTGYHVAAGMIEKLRAAIAKAEAERDEAREWVRRMHAANVTTCVWCGTAFPPGTEPHGVDALREHVTKCERHPIHAEKSRADRAEAERDALKAHAERAEAAWGRLAKAIRTYDRETEVVRKYDWNSTVYAIARDARIAARAAVDAAGDLEARP